LKLNELPDDGWVFLSNEDAKAIDEKRVSAGKGKLIAKIESGVNNPLIATMNEEPDDIFALKKKIIPMLKGIPYVAGFDQVVFTWYPSAKTALLWNINNSKKSFQIMLNGKRIHSIEINPLDVELIRID